MPIKILSLLVFVVACDETAAGVQRDYVDRHREAFVFHVDRARIVAGLREVFADQGIALVEPTTGDTLTTTADGRHWSYVVHLISSRSGYLIHIVGQLHDDSGQIATTMQENDMVWELAQRLEPDRALEITDAANKRADRVAPRAHSVP